MSLEQLAAECVAVDAESAPMDAGQVEAQAGPSPEDRLAAEIAGMVQVAVSVLSPALPSLSTIYTEQTTGAASAAVARVCAKHGWLGDGLFGRYGEEIAAAAILIPLGLQTYSAVQGDIERARRKAEAAELEARQDKARAEEAGPAPE